MDQLKTKLDELHPAGDSAGREPGYCSGGRPGNARGHRRQVHMGEAVTRPDLGRVIIHRVGEGGGVWLTTFFPGIAVWIRSAGFYRGRRVIVGGDARSEQPGAADFPSESGGDTGNLDAVHDANTDRNPNIDAHEHPDTIRNLDRHGERRPFWEFLDRYPDGWLCSLAYRRDDVPRDRPGALGLRRLDLQECNP